MVSLRIAETLGKKDEAAHYLQCSYNYQNIFNEATGFFHEKIRKVTGLDITDYRYSGGVWEPIEWHGENNGWVYRWDVPHNVADLISLMGGNERFIANLDVSAGEPLGRGKYEFYAQLPDHENVSDNFRSTTGTIFTIPYLYNYAGQPWKTQKRIRRL